MKGFVHIVEIILIVIMVFFVFTQFTTLPTISDDWPGVKLSLTAKDVIHSFDKMDVNWFNQSELEFALNQILPDNVIYSVILENSIKPEIKIACLCDSNELTKVDDMLNDYDLTVNGIEVDFDITQVSDIGEVFSLDYDVALIYGYEDLDSNSYAVRNFLNYDKGIIQIADIQEIDSVQGDFFGITFSLNNANSANTSFTSEAKDPLNKINRIYKYFHSFPANIQNKGFDYREDSGILSAWKLEGNTNDIVDGNGGVAAGGLDCTGDEGKVGNGCEMDGLDDYIHVPTSSSLDTLNNDNFLTISMWAKSSAGLGEFQEGWMQYWILRNESSDADFIYARVYNNSLNFRVFNYIDGVDLNEELGTLTSDIHLSWSHYVWVFNETHLSAYINGNLFAVDALEANISRLDDGYYFRIGSGGRVTNSNWEGIIDEVSIYKRSLTPNEIYYHYLSSNKTRGTFDYGTSFEGLLSSGENITQVDGDGRKVLLKQGSGVASCVINYNVGDIGNGRTVWLSETSNYDHENHKTLVKALTAWVAGDEYRIVKADINRPASSYIYKTLNEDMMQNVKITLELGHLY